MPIACKGDAFPWHWRLSPARWPASSSGLSSPRSGTHRHRLFYRLLRSPPRPPCRWRYRARLIGGAPAVTATLTIMTGIIGAVGGPYVLNALRIHAPEARGSARPKAGSPSDRHPDHIECAAVLR